MDFCILGPLRVVRGDIDVGLGPPAQRRLLAVLLTCPNEPLGVDRLIDELWDDRAPASAEHLVHVYTSRLRQLLDDGTDAPRLVRARGGYVLRVEGDEMDAERFLEASRRGRRTRPHRARRTRRGSDRRAPSPGAGPGGRSPQAGPKTKNVAKAMLSNPSRFRVRSVTR